ncbi:MAG: HAD-IIB family hydrolase [Bryobacterales bacterium]|nr:HAD-IIB family hydrolase [Bryobacterales bacterium]
MIKAIAVDLDDTLLTSSWEVSPADQEALRWAKKRGIALIVATGRMPSAARKHTAGISDIIDYLVCYNGALVETSSGKAVAEDPLDSTVFGLLRQIASELEYCCLYFSGDVILSERVVDGDQITSYYKSRTGAKISAYLDQPSMGRIHKLLLYHPGANDGYNPRQSHPFEQIAFDSLSHRVSHLTQVRKTGLGYVECSSLRVSKEKAVRSALGELGLDLGGLLAIGDSYNDLEMIRSAAVGVAVDNAVEELKRVADFVVASHESSGVAEAIYRACN